MFCFPSICVVCVCLNLDIKLGTTINASHLIRKNYLEFIVSKFQIFNVTLLQMVTKTLFFKINKKLIVSFLIQRYFN